MTRSSPVPRPPRARPVRARGRLWLAILAGLLLLSWALELGRSRTRARIEDAGGPLVDVPGTAR